MVSIVEVKDVEIPSNMQRAIAAQAEAERERRAKVINAEGEYQASEQLRRRPFVIETHPIALQLRYLQTLLELGSSPSDDGRLSRADRAAQAVSQPEALNASSEEAAAAVGEAVTHGRRRTPCWAWAGLRRRGPFAGSVR